MNVESVELITLPFRGSQSTMEPKYVIFSILEKLNCPIYTVIDQNILRSIASQSVEDSLPLVARLGADIYKRLHKTGNLTNLSDGQLDILGMCIFTDIINVIPNGQLFIPHYEYLLNEVISLLSC
jgi:hypothetical protein